jgi:hypothetical protein
MHHCPYAKIDILAIVMSRTGTPRTSNITSVTSLLTLRTYYPYKLISETHLHTRGILSHLHLRTLQWLRHLILIYHFKSRTTSRRSPSLYNRF